MAHLKAQETRGNDVSRKEWKFRLTRRLYEQGYNRQDVLNLFLFIDWLITLPANLEASFIYELEQYEQEKQMQYVTSVERMAKAAGHQEGLEEGRQEGLTQGILESIELGLELKFGQEGLQIFPELTQLKDLDNLRAIQRGLKQATTIDELRAHLLPSQHP